MKIVCATNMPFASEAFSTLGEVTVLEGRDIGPADVRDVEILALRSTTRVNRELLEGSRVRFVGTATIGTDHMDLEYLDQHGIRWCYAPGCNANSVAEYVTAALLCLARRHGLTLRGKTVGIVGVGNVGSRVEEKVRALGMRPMLNDPPRARSEGTGRFVPLDELLAQADIVTLHVPLTRLGIDRTLHLGDESFFRKLKPGAILINAARGPVLDSDALLEARRSGRVSHVVLDTWEGEPVCRLDALAAADLATPHIAGHSFEGKAMGTLMVYREACRFLGIQPQWELEPYMPPPLVPELMVAQAGRRDEELLQGVVRSVYDIEADDRRFRLSASPDEPTRGREFDRLRRDYPERREFRYTRVRVHDAGPAAAASLRGLGFPVTE